MTALVKNMFSQSQEELAEYEKGQALKIYLVDLKNIEPSVDNPYSVDDESVANLAENIESHGLKQNLIAQKEGTLITLLSGERRYSALKKLTDEGRHYTYNGVDITGKAPVCYQKELMSERKILDMIAANAHRDMDADEKVRVIKATQKALDDQVKKGQYKWPDKERKAHVISEITGIKEHFVKDTLANLNRPQDVSEPEEDPTKPDKPSRPKKEVDEDTKAVRKMLSTLKAANKSCLTAGDAALAGADPEVQEKIYEQIELLLNKLELLKKSSDESTAVPDGQTTIDEFINEEDEEW